ncbi:hypothetical protein LC593_10835 [Nostoc sp. CHAB 5844]|nr:hypothetical protein [Nostoc sp. CHAB 5844]
MTNNNYPQPDPAWIYYPTWQQVTAAHAALEEVIGYMATDACEEATVISDNEIDQILDKAHVAIIQACEALPLRKEPPQIDSV